MGWPHRRITDWYAGRGEKRHRWIANRRAEGEVVVCKPRWIASQRAPREGASHHGLCLHLYTPSP